MKYTHKKFSNGLNVLLMPSADSQSVLFSVLVKAGSRYENKKIAGVSHFLEHVFFKGSANYPKPTDISQIVDAIGGDFNASTSKETTEFYIKAEKHHFDLIFKVLSDVLLNPLFNEQEIEKEKGVVIEEINMYNDSPASQAETKLEEIMWPGDQLGVEIIGSKKTVRALTRKEIFDYRNTFYTPGNIILSVSGSFNEKKVLSGIAKSWGVLKSRRAPGFKRTADRQNKPRLHLRHKETEQAHLIFGFKGYGHGDKNNAAALLLSSILGGNMSSRLFVKIREQMGLAYYVGASHSSYYHTGNFTIQAGLRVNSAADATREIIKELREIRHNQVSEEELKRAKDFVKGKMAISFESVHRKIDWLADNFARTGKFKSFEQFNKEIDGVSAKEIKQVALEIFKNSKMSLSIVGPFKDKKQFQVKI